jgi:very-short-patch-repair endonuclease
VPEHVEAWWSRRQWSKGVLTPYAVGEFRADWERYPVLVRQYHPDLNHGITLTQVPPAADVYLLWQCEFGHLFVATPWEQRQRPGRSRRRSTWCPECAAGAGGGHERSTSARICAKTPALAVGEPFASECAPKPASAAEALLRQKLTARLEFEPGYTAVRVRHPFFEHLEVWPDIVLPDLRVAIEYDTIGRDGLEHVGKREAVDLRKDRLLRAAGWEVVRVRCGKLRALGPWDVAASGTITAKLVGQLIDRLREVRGDLIVNSYLR